MIFNFTRLFFKQSIEAYMQSMKFLLTFILISFIFLANFLQAQSFLFQRKIDPFPITDLSGSSFDLPLTGGMNRPVHQFVDIDGDDDLDLFIQDRASLLTFFRNSGSTTGHEFEWVTDRFEGLTVGEWFKFADVDSDDDVDLFAEKPFGNIRYFRNDGSSTNPNFVSVSDTLRDNTGAIISADALSIPDWADIDCDDDLDLFLGRSQNGHITFYEHIGLGSNGVPQYQHITDFFEDIEIITGGGEGVIRPGRTDGRQLHGANSLTFIDIDDDQDNDLFWGDFFEESLIFLENSGSCTDPNIDITMTEYPPNNPVMTGGYNVPRFADIDGDLDYDMFLGVLGGSGSFLTDLAENLYFYENIGSVTQPDFSLRTRQFISSIDIGQNTNIALADVDSDGDLDLFLANEQDLASPGNNNSRIYFFENQGSATNPSFSLIDDHFLGVDQTFDLNYDPVFVDINNDGLLDMFLGKWDGGIDFYRNEGSPGSPDFVEVTGNTNIDTLDIGQFSTPAFADLDGDRDFDIVIGESAGNLNYYRNEGSASNPLFVLETENYQNITVGNFSNPFFSDIDEDGDQDLLVGSESDGTFLYRNQGDSLSPNFVLDNSFDLPLHLRSSPVLADIDDDGDLDVFSGANGGGIVYYENQEVVGIDPASGQNPPVASTIQLLRNYPNPFNPQTTIEYEIRLEAELLGKTHTLSIVNILGQTIRHWEFANTQTTIHRTVEWDGRDRIGQEAPSGIYFYRLTVDKSNVRTGKMLLVR